MRLKLIEKTDTPLLTLEEVKAHLKIQHNEEDHLLLRFIKTATDWVEEETGKTLLYKTWECTHRNCSIVLPHPPIQNILEVRIKSFRKMIMKCAAAA